MNVSPLGITTAKLPSAVPAWRGQASSGQLLGACRLAWEQGGQLVALWASDERDLARGYCVHVVLQDRDGLLQLDYTAPENDPACPDLATIFPAANRMQRAAFDLTGVQSDADDQRPWLWQASWPIDQYPLRRDFEALAKWEPGEEDYPFVRVTGDGVHEIPVGPVHAGIIEPGHFRFGVAGEPVLYLQLRLFYVHKGTEKRFEQMMLAEGSRLAGRISGDSTVAFAWAYAMAVESAATSTEVRPSDAARLREASSASTPNQRPSHAEARLVIAATNAGIASAAATIRTRQAR
jgi:Ni,Fe-hydrogenase III component G